MDTKFIDIKNSKGVLNFQIKSDPENPLDISIVNGIRRTILQKIPTVGIPQDNIIIEKNATSLHNEFMKHRLSMIPLCIDPTNYNHDYLFVLDVENKTDSVKIITTNNLKIFPLKPENKQKTDLPVNKDNYDFNNEIPDKLKQKIIKPYKIKDIISYIIITELKNKTSDKEYQYFKCYFIPNVGNGSDNTLFNNISQCSYSYHEDDKLLKKAISDELKLKKITSQASKKIFEKEFTNSYKQRYYNRNDENEPYWYNFVIKSNHYFNSNKCFLIALELLIDQLNKCSDNFKLITIDPDKSRYSVTTKPNNFEFILDNENDTIGNILQSYISNNITEETLISFCGYKKIHPLENKVKLIVSNKLDIEDIDELTLVNKTIFNISEYIDEIVNILQDMHTKFKNI